MGGLFSDFELFWTPRRSAQVLAKATSGRDRKAGARAVAINSSDDEDHERPWGRNGHHDDVAVRAADVRLQDGLVRARDLRLGIALGKSTLPAPVQQL